MKSGLRAGGEAGNVQKCMVHVEMPAKRGDQLTEVANSRVLQRGCVEQQIA